MSYTDPKNYSVLNSYDFRDKNHVNSFLDWASTPCRRVLGGRNVYLRSLKHEAEMSTAKKVAVIFFSVLIFPIALISLASLAVKVITLPWIWEKNKMAEQVAKTTNVYNQFILACNQNRHSDALAEIAKVPELAQDITVNRALFTAINRKINNNDSWDEIKDSLKLLSSSDAISLIDHAVKARLANEFNKNYSFIKGDDISDLIKNSLDGKDALKECYDKLLSSSLNVDVSSGNVALNARKMELADHVFTFRTRMMQSYAANAIEHQAASIFELNERDDLFGGRSNAGLTLQYRMMFKSMPDMQQIHDAVQTTRNVTLIGQDAFDEINDAILQSQVNMWSIIRQACSRFDNALRGACNSQGERKVLDLIQEQLKRQIFDVVDISSRTVITNEDKAKLNAIKADVKQINMPNLQQVQGNQSLLDSMLEQLRLQKMNTIVAFAKLIKDTMAPKATKIMNDILNPVNP